jgi:uncharacterized protein (TIGR02757 family)
MRNLKVYLDTKHEQFNQLGFIKDDPISIPHRFQKKEDIEIIAFFMAIISWGQRKSIISSGKKLLQIFNHAPHDFIINHQETDLKKCLGFVHRTFNEEDLLSLIAYIKSLYLHGDGLEFSFSKHLKSKDKTIENALNGFRMDFEKSEFFLNRTKKHIAYPNGGSACKRLNMYLRWMVRKDKYGVDFGIWNSISPSQLICPLDVHVIKQAFALNLIDSEKSDWKTAIQLTEKLKKFDKSDPVKYDFALFGIGIDKKNLEGNLQ